MAFNRNYLSWKTLKETIWTDIVTVSMFGSEHARRDLDISPSLHPQFPLIPRKSLGAAMINLEGSYADYRLSKLRGIAKNNLKLAKKRKYLYAKIEAVSAIDAIMEDQSTNPVRNAAGRPMEPLYFSRSKFEVILRRNWQCARREMSGRKDRSLLPLCQTSEIYGTLITFSGMAII